MGSGASKDTERKVGLDALLESLSAGEHDEAIKAYQQRRRYLSWERFPERLVLLRHGQSEGNVDPNLYAVKGDSLLELTSRGIEQAGEAGQRIAKLLPEDGRVMACVSPFTRTYQTFLGLYRGGFPQEKVGIVHVDPQIREQEFGNFQDPGLTQKVRFEEKKVGRFYYRRPNAESSADVFDRVSSFLDKLLQENGAGLLLKHKTNFDMCLIVTHGLTVRLLLMTLFKWSVETFETCWNLGNCHHVTLKKNMDSLRYEICVEESFPARLPWGTREIWIVPYSLSAPESLQNRLKELQAFRDSLKASDDDGASDTKAGVEKLIDELQNHILASRSKPYTIVDYIGIPQPRTAHIQELLDRCVPGHGLNGKPEELEKLAKEATDRVLVEHVEFIDWWGPLKSYRGKMLRETNWSIHGSPKECFPADCSPQSVGIDLEV